MWYADLFIYFSEMCNHNCDILYFYFLILFLFFIVWHEIIDTNDKIDMYDDIK